MMDRNYRKVFGKRIRDLRKITRTTQMDLAKYLGYSSTVAITQIENGEKGVKFENIQKIADFFGIDAAFLMDNFDTGIKDLEMAVNLRKLMASKKGRSELKSIRTLLDAAVQDIDAERTKKQ